MILAGKYWLLSLFLEFVNRVHTVQTVNLISNGNINLKALFAKNTNVGKCRQMYTNL